LFLYYFHGITKENDVFFLILPEVFIMGIKTVAIKLNENGQKALEELKELSGYRVNTKAVTWAILSAVSSSQRISHLESKLEESRQEVLELQAVIRHLEK